LAAIHGIPDIYMMLPPISQNLVGSAIWTAQWQGGARQPPLARLEHSSDVSSELLQQRYPCA